MKKVKLYLTSLFKKYQAKKYGVPYNIDKFWPYYHESLTKQMTKLGFELGTIQSRSNCGDPVCMLQNKDYEYIYVISEIHKLKGGDFLQGTNYEFDLTFYERIKRR